MTYFIDISGNQLSLDIGAVRDAGNEAVIVKAVAAYRPEHTIAEGYKSNVDRTIAAGLPKGHYLVPNSQNTPKQSAAFFAANLYRRERGDVFMLDNEPLDTYKTFWRDDQVVEFFEEFMRLTGEPWSQMWLYCPAALTRASGPWTRVEEARKHGLRIVWVSYGDNDPDREDGEEPLLGGGITGWDVHQFTSTYRVPGYGGDLDRDYSPHSVDYLFGGDMPLNNYVLRSPSVVILEDDRDPYVSWQNHLDRTGGLRGGVDLVAPVGTPVYARTAGVMLHLPADGTAGNSSRFRHDANPGWEDVFSHLSRYVGVSGQHFEAGEVVAYTGDTGGVAPHLHWHLLDPDKVRRNPWNYFSGSSTAGGGTPPIEEDDMYDADARNELVTILHEIKAQNTAHDKKQSMPIYELVKTATDAQVWYVVDRLQRVRVPNPATLSDYVYFIQVVAGQPANAVVKTVGNLSAFGVEV